MSAVLNKKESSVLNVEGLTVDFDVKGKSVNILSEISFDLKSGDTIRVWCMEWDSDNENVKASFYWDGLAVNISSKEQIDFIQNEAY